MTNPLKTLPRDVLERVREVASDRVEPHPTAAMIKSLTFTHEIPAGNDSTGRFRGARMVVSGETLTMRRRKCYDPNCWRCIEAATSAGCSNAIMRTVPTLCRRYKYFPFRGYGGWSQYAGTRDMWG